MSHGRRSQVPGLVSMKMNAPQSRAERDPSVLELATAMSHQQAAQTEMLETHAELMTYFSNLGVPGPSNYGLDLSVSTPSCTSPRSRMPTESLINTDEAVLRVVTMQTDTNTSATATLATSDAGTAGDQPLATMGTDVTSVYAGPIPVTSLTPSRSPGRPLAAPGMQQLEMMTLCREMMESQRQMMESQRQMNSQLQVQFQTQLQAQLQTQNQMQLEMMKQLMQQAQLEPLQQVNQLGPELPVLQVPCSDTWTSDQGTPARTSSTGMNVTRGTPAPERPHAVQPVPTMRDFQEQLPMSQRYSNQQPGTLLPGVLPPSSQPRAYSISSRTSTNPQASMEQVEEQTAPGQLLHDVQDPFMLPRQTMRVPLDGTIGPLTQVPAPAAVPARLPHQYGPKPVLPPRFDGKGSWAEFMVQFDSCANIGKWTEVEKAQQLASLLSGTALTTYCAIPTHNRGDYALILAALTRRFQERKNVAQVKLESRVRNQNEGIQAVANNIWDLTGKAFSDFSMEFKERMALDALKRAVDVKLRLRISDFRAVTLDEAVEVVEQYESIVSSDQASKRHLTTRAAMTESAGTSLEEMSDDKGLHSKLDCLLSHMDAQQ